MKKNEYELSHVAFVVLGLISEESCNGKTIDEKIEKRGMRDWTSIGKSSIYGVLKKLEKDGLVKSWIEELDNRMIRVYGITPYGFNVLKRKVKMILSNYYGRNNEDFYVAYSMFPLLSQEEQIKAFTASLKKIKEHKTLLKNMLRDNSDYPINVIGLFKHPMMILQTDIDFFEWVIKVISKDNNFSKTKSNNKVLE